MSEMYLALPFPVEIWGTVGQWASALATTLSFLGAVIFFARNKIQADRAQALLFGFYVLSSSPMRVQMRNASASGFYDFSILLRKRPFKDVVFGGSSTYIVEFLPNAKKEWEAAPEVLPLYLDRPVGVLKSGEEIVQEYREVTFGDFYELHVSFMDAASVKWKLVISSVKDQQRHKLTRVKFDDGYEREGSRWDAYKTSLEIWRARKDTRKWLRANR